MMVRFRWLMLTVAMLALGKAGWIDAKAMLAQQLLKKAWQQTVIDRQAHKPWPWFDSQPVAELTWPDGRRQILLQGSSGQALAFAPGLELMDARGERLPAVHWQQADTLVVGGHNDTHFADLENIAVNAEFTLMFADGSRKNYRVADKRVMDSRHQLVLPTSYAGGVSGQLLLVTCYPFKALTAGGPLRYVMVANPV